MKATRILSVLCLVLSIAGCKKAKTTAAPVPYIIGYEWLNQFDFPAGSFDLAYGCPGKWTPTKTFTGPISKKQFGPSDWGLTADISGCPGAPGAGGQPAIGMMQQAANVTIGLYTWNGSTYAGPVATVVPPPTGPGPIPPGAGTCAGISLGVGGSLNGFQPMQGSYLTTRVDTAPLDPQSAAIVGAAGFAGNHLHMDFGTQYGYPYLVVDSSVMPKTPILVPLPPNGYGDESDITVEPIDGTAPIEANPPNGGGITGDNHMMILDRTKCWLYETESTTRSTALAYAAVSETIWNMQTMNTRPITWTSADAAGLPIFPAAVRYDEILAGSINHALRFTLNNTKNSNNGGYFVQPATHKAGTNFGISNIMGMRIRLQASYDISGFSPTNQIILKALKTYGMVLADNGNNFYVQGTNDSRWNDTDLSNLASIPSSAFEVVQMTPPFPGYDNTNIPTGAAPVINSFTASANNVTAGTAVTLTANTTGQTFNYIDKLGPMNAPTITDNPAATTTYTLYSTNGFGRSTKAVTVTVGGGGVTPPPTNTICTLDGTPITCITVDIRTH